MTENRNPKETPVGEKKRVSRKRNSKPIKIETAGDRLQDVLFRCGVHETDSSKLSEANQKEFYLIQSVCFSLLTEIDRWCRPWSNREEARKIIICARKLAQMKLASEEKVIHF
jgi:hypothetical protein